MTILFIVPSLSRLWGGTTVAVLSSFYALRAQGMKVELWSARRDGDEIAPEVLADPDIRFFDSHTSWRYSSGLKKALEQEAKCFDIIHIHGMWLYPHFIAAKVAARQGVPYIISPHGMIEADALARKGLKKRIYWELIEKHNFQNATTIHAITENEKNQISKLVPAKPCFVLPNGIETLEANPKSLFPDNPTILFVGRIHPKKALDRLIEALMDIPNTRLIVAGDGDEAYKKEILALVDRLGISKRVEFLGFVGKMAKVELYAKASFLAVPSHSEVLSLVALEAISHGLPVLISRACHFDDIGQNGAGVVMKDNEPSSIADGVRQMLSSDLYGMSKSAFRLSQKYSLDTVSSRLLLEYEKILQANK